MADSNPKGDDSLVGDECFSSSLMYDLLLSQKEAARSLEIAYLALRDDPCIARQVRTSSNDAQDQHLKTHGLMRQYQGTAVIVVTKMLPLIQLGVRKKKAGLVQKGFKKVLTYVDDMIEKTIAMKTRYYTIKENVNEEINTIVKKNHEVKENKSKIETGMKKSELQLRARVQETQELKLKTQNIEEELKRLKLQRQEFLEQSVQTREERKRESFVGILTTGLSTVVTVAAGPVAGAIFFGGAAVANHARIKQAGQQAVEASEKIKEDIVKEEDNVWKNRKRLVQIRDDAIETLCEMEKLSHLDANQIDKQSLELAFSELGKVLLLLGKVLFFWEDLSAKLKFLSNSHNDVELLIDEIHDPDLHEDIDESVKQVYTVWNSFGFMCTRYVTESEKQLDELYAFLARPVDQMAITECNERKQKILDDHRKEIKELESKINDM